MRTSPKRSHIEGWARTTEVPRDAGTRDVPALSLGGRAQWLTNAPPEARGASNCIRCEETDFHSARRAPPRLSSLAQCWTGFPATLRAPRRCHDAHGRDFLNPKGKAWMWRG